MFAAVVLTLAIDPATKPISVPSLATVVTLPLMPATVVTLLLIPATVVTFALMPATVVTSVALGVSLWNL